LETIKTLFKILTPGLIMISLFFILGADCDGVKKYFIRGERNDSYGEIQQPPKSETGDYRLTGLLKPYQSSLYEIFSYRLKIVQINVSGTSPAILKWGVDIIYPYNVVNVAKQQSIPISQIQDSTFVVEIVNNSGMDYEYTITLSTEIK